MCRVVKPGIGMTGQNSIRFALNLELSSVVEKRHKERDLAIFAACVH